MAKLVPEQRKRNKGTMGTLAFFPWLTVDSTSRIGDFELKPVLIDPAAVRGNESPGHWAEVDADASAVLRAYRTPPDIPIRTATVVRFASGSFTADLSEADIDRVFTLGEAIAFAGLSQREFFQHTGYSNRDSFQLVVQRFVPGKTGVSLVHRRRHGSVTIGIPGEYWVARMEPHIERLNSFELDHVWTDLILKEMDGDEEFDRAMRSFNDANTDRARLSEAHELVSTVSAFQQFFSIGGGNTKATRGAFVAALQRVPSTNVTPKKAKVLNRLPQRPNGVRDIWMEDLCALRGNVGHGHAAESYPSMWSPKEHLLIAAQLFPLLAKLRLDGAGKRSLTSHERFSLGLIDLLLCSENVLEAERDEYGVASEYEWNSLKEEGFKKMVGAWGK